MLLRIVSIIVPLLVIAALGFVYARSRSTDMSSANIHTMEVFLPATVFATLSERSFEPAQFGGLLVAGAFIILGSGALGLGLARLLGIQPKTLVPPLMFNNCGNLGLPLALLSFGPAALGPAIALFVLSNLLQFSLGLYMLDHHARVGTLWRMPVVLATAAGLCVSSLHIVVWPPLMLGVKMLGDISVPLLLFSLGVRLSQAHFSSWRIGLLGALARPLLGFSLAWLVCAFLGETGLQRSLLLLFGALPPGVLNFVFAERYQQEPGKVAAIVMMGNLGAVLTVPLALYLVLP